MNELQLKEISSLINESHGKELVSDLASSLKDFEQLRSKVKKIVETKYPAQMKGFVKSYSDVDKSLTALENYLNGL